MSFRKNKCSKYRIISTRMEKKLKFFFPIPSIGILAFSGILLCFGKIDGAPIQVMDWLLFMAVLFIFFILPLDILIFAVKKIYLAINSKKRKKHELQPQPQPEPELHSEPELEEVVNHQPQLQLEPKEGAKHLLYNNKFDYMNGYDFEQYCAALLRNFGYSNVETTKASNDNGIDILATLGGVKYGIQCKCYSSDIGVKAIQEAYTGATYYNCHVPVVLTNRHFTRQAQELAEKTNVLLWDREYLLFLVNALNKDIEKVKQ